MAYNKRIDYIIRAENRARRSPFLALVNHTIRNDAMFYFVERNGRAVKSTKHLFAAQLAAVALNEMGIPDAEIRITDSNGKEHPKVGIE